MEARPRRTAAHERAVRRAWAERRNARLQRDIANDHMRMREEVQAELRSECFRHGRAVRDYQASIAGLAEQVAEQAARGDAQRSRRLASAQRARRMIATARSAARDRQAAHNVTLAQLAKLRRDMADPSQPERASDIARLVKERDEARTANAALQGRAERSERAVQDMAGKFEDMVSRVTRAEAALRAVQKAA